MLPTKQILNVLQYHLDACSNLLFPRLCFGCDQVTIDEHEFLCLNCMTDLPFTGFEAIRDNPVEKLFWGRIKCPFASSTFFYQEDTPVQSLIHQIKYKNQRKLGYFMGEMMGFRLNELITTQKIDYLIPMPLHPKKEKSRGYNQATLLCHGISKVTGTEVNHQCIKRVFHTATQTRKSRIQRWENVSEVFEVADSFSLKGKNVLLVDDVITTGASTESCSQKLVDNGANQVSICSLAFTL